MKRDLSALASREYDLLVVGGGFTGAAILREAAERGLSAALVEARDFGSGASWHSLRTVHGGLRHLQKLDIARLRESMSERRAWLKTAPAAVRPLGFLAPASSPLDALKLRAGMALTDLLTPDRNQGLAPESALPGSGFLSAAAVADRVPGLRAPSGAAVWWDAQAVHAERLVLALLHAASEAGAAVANHAPAEALRTREGRVVGVRLRDALTDRRHEVAARSVVLAANDGVAPLLRWSGIRPPDVPWLDALNLVLRVPPPSAFAVGARSRGRFLFLSPWSGGLLAGTDYAPSGSAPLDPEAFLREVASAFPWVEIERRDVSYVHRGRVPGLSADQLWSRHRLFEHGADGAAGAFSVIAAKLTTARAIAEEVVQRVGGATGRSVSPSKSSVSPLSRSAPLAGSLAEQAREAVTEEMAASLADVLLRRIGPGATGPALDQIQTASAALLQQGWDEARLLSDRTALELELAALRAPFA